jgi:hypothetical protein
MKGLHAAVTRLSHPVLDASVRTDPPGSSGRYDRRDRSRVAALEVGRGCADPTTDGHFGGDLQHG